MAWVGILIGTLAGISTAVLGYAAFGWPLWACLLAYPAAGVLTAALVIAALMLRRPPLGPELQLTSFRPAAA
ncbi:hypothetical protein ACUXV3_17370 [Roseobacteraceae bacterium NS-SX3]